MPDIFLIGIFVVLGITMSCDSFELSDWRGWAILILFTVLMVLHDNF